MSYKSGINRYSDEELELFKVHIQQKLDKAISDRDFILKQIEEISDSKRNDGDWIDDTSNSSDLELLYTMISRSRKHIQDLENALLRIHHKNYGICNISGSLIDKRRLFAVPTTTKSVEVKKMAPHLEKKKTKVELPISKKRKKQKTTSKVVQKSNKFTQHKSFLEDKDDFEDFFQDIDLNNIEIIDTENFSNE